MGKSLLKLVVGFLLICINCTLNAPNALVFQADFSKPTVSEVFGGSSIAYGGQNVVLWASGTGMEVHYPAGSYSPEGPIVGGFGTWTDHPVPTQTAILKFSVFFPEDFDFVHGGKLPGLYGGKKFCAGGDPAVDCFSTRVMWRDDGKGELYLYANREAQDPAICEMPGNYCAPVYGWSLNTGAWTFQRGVWTEVEELMTLNTPGVQNGVLSIKINGEEVVYYDNLVYRIAEYPNIRIQGLDFDTFFGGTGDYWATPKHQLTKFRDITIESV